MLKLFLILQIFLIISFQASAQTVSLLKDIETSIVDIAIENAIVIPNGRVIYKSRVDALDKLSEKILVSSAPGENAPQRLTLAGGKEALSLTRAGGLVFFLVLGENSQSSIWRTDGTNEGTFEVISFRGTLGSIFAIKDILYFDFFSLTTFKSNIYTSDGTVTGTRVVIPDAGLTRFSKSMTEHNGELFFVGKVSGISGLFKTDGTFAGTSLYQAFSQEPKNIYSLGNKLFFGANNGTGLGIELFTASGSSPGDAFQIKDIIPGSESGDPLKGGGSFLNGNIYFSAYTPGNQGLELWKSDGTSEGTLLVNDFTPGLSKSSVPKGLTSINGKILFTAESQGKRRLYSYDGSVLSEILVGNEINIDGDVITNQSQTKAFYNIGTNGKVIVTDGSQQGTVVLNDNAISGVYETASFLVVNNKILFATEEARPQFYLLDMETLQRRESLGFSYRVGNFGSETYGYLSKGGKCAFYERINSDHYQYKIFSTDGKTENTKLFFDSLVLSDQYFSGYSAIKNKFLIFTSGRNFHSIWSSRGVLGTEQEVIRLPQQDIVKNVSLGNTAFIQVELPDRSYRQYISDGTKSGTYRKNIINYPKGAILQSEEIGGVTQKDDVTYIFGSSRAVVPKTGQLFEYWIAKYSGDNQISTVTSTVTKSELKYKIPFIDRNTPYLLTNDNRIVIAGSVDSKLSVVISDGTAKGTVKLISFKNTDDVDYFFESFLGKERNNIYFSVRERVINTNVESIQYWISDGTVNGTRRIDSQDGFSLRGVLGNKNIGIASRINESTKQNILSTINNGSYSTLREFCSIGFFNFNFTPDDTSPLVFFEADDCVTGTELWKTDGTPEGTQIVIDLNKSKNLSNYNFVTQCGGSIIFTSQNEYAGEEPHIITFSDNCPTDDNKINPGWCGCGAQDVDESNPFKLMCSSDSSSSSGILAAPQKISGKWDKKKREFVLSVATSMSGVKYVFEYKTTKGSKKPTASSAFKKITSSKNKVTIKKLTKGTNIFVRAYYLDSSGKSPPSKEKKFSIK